MKYFLMFLIIPALAQAQCIYNCGGGIYPICEPVMTCVGGQCQTVTVCR